MEAPKIRAEYNNCFYERIIFYTYVYLNTISSARELQLIADLNGGANMRRNSVPNIPQNFIYDN